MRSTTQFYFTNSVFRLSVFSFSFAEKILEKLDVRSGRFRPRLFIIHVSRSTFSRELKSGRKVHSSSFSQRRRSLRGIVSILRASVITDAAEEREPSTRLASTRVAESLGERAREKR